MRKIRQMSTIAVVIILPYLLIYPFLGLEWQLNIVFFDPEAWGSHRWTAQDAPNLLSTRLLLLAVWIPPNLAAIISLIIALRIALYLRSGAVFETKVAKSIVHLGWATIASPALAMLAGCITPMIMSWNNPEGPLPLRLWYTTANLGLIFCGVAFLLMGSVMREAIKMARENEEFV